MHSARRLFLRGGLAFLALLGLPRALLAGAWPQQAFESTAAKVAMKKLFGTDRTTPSGEILLAAPLIAEDGAVVPISVETSLPGVKSISIVVKRNPRPLAASFEFSSQMLPKIACRIKMAETSEVMAVVQTDSGIFSTSAEVKVTMGGCA
jgi:sulfur-oxidizing protein SoxY